MIVAETLSPDMFSRLRAHATFIVAEAKFAYWPGTLRHFLFCEVQATHPDSETICMFHRITKTGRETYLFLTSYSFEIMFFQ